MKYLDLKYFAMVLLVAWMFTVIAAVVFQVIHNDQERELTKINACVTADDIGACWIAAGRS